MNLVQPENSVAPNRGRARKHKKLILIIIGIVVLFHLIVLGLIFGGSGDNAADEKPAAAAEKTLNTENKEGKSSGNAQEKQLAADPDAPVSMYRKPLDLPGFGADFDFSKARHGDFRPGELPGVVVYPASGMVVELNTRKVLWEKNCNKPVYIASMVKMMTMLLTMEALDRNPALTLDTMVPITGAAVGVKRTGVMFLVKGTQQPLRTLLQGVCIKSANDAATQLGEFIGGGDLDKFVTLMNERAAEIGMKNFKAWNPCGLPDKSNRMAVASAHDMTRLAEYLLEYPELLKYCSMLKMEFVSEPGKAPTVFVNTNKLINPHYPGVDGLKTGFLNASGFCLCFSVLRDNRRVIGCVTGFKVARERDVFVRRLIDMCYGVRQPVKAAPENRKTAVKKVRRTVAAAPKQAKTGKAAKPAKSSAKNTKR